MRRGAKRACEDAARNDECPGFADVAPRPALKGGTTRNSSHMFRGMRSPTFGLWLTPVRWRFNNFRGATSRTPRPAHQHAHTNAFCAHHHLRTCACKPSQKTALRVRCAGLTRTDHGDALLLLRCVRRARTLLAKTQVVHNLYALHTQSKERAQSGRLSGLRAQAQLCQISTP